MRTKEDENMQAYIAEQVSEILNERPRRKKAPARRALGGAALALLITILTVVVAVRALAACDEPPAGAALPAATWTSVQISTPETPEPTAEPEPELVPVTVTLTSRYAPVTDEEIELMARIVHLESNNQPFEGQQAVAECILNRIWADNFPDTAQEVVYSAGQFTTAEGAARAVPTLENYMAVMAALYGEPVTPLDVVYFNGVPESRHVWAQIGDHVFCYQYPWAYASGQYEDMEREVHTVSATIYNWTVTHPEHGSIEVTAVNRYYAVQAAAQDWGISSKLSLHAECEVERGEAVLSAAPELDAEDERDG